MLTKKKIHLLKYAGVAVIALFSLCYTQMEVSISGLEAARFAVIQAWGEQGVFHITHTQFKTVDKIIRDGKIYSDKPLPLSWTIGNIHKAVHTLTGLDFKNNYHLLIYTYNLLAGGLVNILIFLWLFSHLRRYRRGRPETKFILALSAALGTWLLSYSVIVNNHTPAALAFLGWFIVLEKFYRRPGYSAAVVSGLAAGVVALMDLPTGFFTCLINLFALFFAGKKQLRYVGAGAAASVAAAVFWMGLNYYAYGTILPLYIARGEGTYAPGTDMKNHLGYFFETLFGYRGLFSYQPFLLFVFPAIWFLRKRLTAADIGALAASLVCIIFYQVMTNEYGGAAYGFRYVIPVIPVLWYFAAIWIMEQKNKALVFCAVFCIFWGVIASLAGAYAPFGLAFEGYRSPPGHVTRTIRSSFTGNLLSWSYENAPDGFLTSLLRRHYGMAVSRRYLLSSYLMLKKIEPLARIAGEK